MARGQQRGGARRWRACCPALVVVLAAGAAGVPAAAVAAPRRERVVQLSEVVDRIREIERVVVEAERGAVAAPEASEEDLARRLVEGQLKLTERDTEEAAIVFLDLIENHPESQAAPQARYYLGEALALLGMPRWAAETFSANLADGRPDARRFHERSVARLLELRHPAREPGFARRPGTSATPEARARLASLGLATQQDPPVGIVSDADAKRLERWAESFPASDRSPELRYAYGRYLFLSGQPEKARAELDALVPTDVPLSAGGEGAAYRIRAAYVAAAAALAEKDQEGALDRLRRISKVRPSKPEDRRIVELAWMAIGRIHHDRDETPEAVRAYRRVGRDSPYFPEAMYETAWTLLRDGAFDRAVQALDLLLVYDPQSPLVAEIKQLRGKIKIQQRDYAGAESEFLGLRREFDALAKQLESKLRVKDDSVRYFSAVIGQDMRHFVLEAVLPVGATQVARALPRAAQSERLAREVGELEEMLRDTRAMLAQMEEAVQARDRTRLFTDLGALAASIDMASSELVDLEADLVRRAGARAAPAGWDGLEAERLRLRDRADEPLGRDGWSRAKVVERLQDLERQAHHLQLTVAALRAQLVAAERYYEETRKHQKIDHRAFLGQAAELRDTLAALEDELADLHHRMRRAETSLRFRDPQRDAQQRAVAEYHEHLARMYAALGSGRDPETEALWQRAEGLRTRAAAARTALDRAAGLRLRVAMAVLVEERANLDGYLVQMRVTQAKTRGLAGDVMAAAYRDVVQEVQNLVLRSEVGLLDLAWSMKEFEQQAVERLEKRRSRDLEELDRTLEQGLEDLER